MIAEGSKSNCIGPPEFAEQADQSCIDAEREADGLCPYEFFSDYNELTAIALAQASIDRFSSVEDEQRTFSSSDSRDASDRLQLASALEILGSFKVQVKPRNAEQSEKPTSLGRFQLLAEQGRGGFGIVFRAFDPILRREVALKVPRPERLIAGLSPEHFVREAQVAASLEHPGIVRVYEAQQLGPIWYIASAYCEGPTLADWIDSQEMRLCPSIAAKIVAEIADAVQFAHTRGVLHLDLKPQNILLELASDSILAPKAMVTDFGLAGKCEPKVTDLTRRIAGTPAYMAPEQLKGDAVQIGTTTDVYALGSILYEMLSWRCSKSLANLPSTSQERYGARIRSPLNHIPSDLEAVCEKSLRLRPAERYQSASDFADDLRRFLKGENVTARSAPWLERAYRCIRRRPFITTLSTALVLTIIGSVAMIAYLWRNAESNLAHLRVEQSVHAETADRMRRSLLNLTWLTQESRLQPHFATFQDEPSVRLLQEVVKDVHRWAGGLTDDAINGAALRAAQHSLASTSGVSRLDRKHRDQEFVAGMKAWCEVIAKAPTEPQCRRALALHLMTYAAGLEYPKWLWWRNCEASDPAIDETVSQLIAEPYAFLLVERANKSARLGKYADAFTLVKSSITLLTERMALPDPDNTRQRIVLAAYTSLADIAGHVSKPGEAGEALIKLAELTANVLPADECDPLVAFAIGRAHDASARPLARIGRLEEALADYNRAYPYLVHAATRLPEDMSIRLKLVLSLQHSATINSSLSRDNEAIFQASRAIWWLDDGLARFRGHRQLHGRRASLDAFMSKLMRAVGDKDAELANLENAVKDYAAIDLMKQDSKSKWMNAIACWHSLGSLYAELGRNADATSAYQQSLSLLKQLESRRGQHPQFAVRMTEAQNALAALNKTISQTQYGSQSDAALEPTSQ